MKRKIKINSLLRLIVLCAFPLFARDQFLYAQADSSGLQKDQFIKVEKLNNKTILIRMGYDAVTAINTQKGIVVIDAGISTGLTSKYRKIIESEFQQGDIAYLINTHGHPDHTGGNGIFAGAKIIGQENCLNEISNRQKDPDKIKSSLKKIVNDYDKQLQSLSPGINEWKDVFCQKIRYEYAYEDELRNRTVKSPNLTFSDTLNLDLRDVTFSLIYFGKAHSESDILVHIPEMKILMVGDLFSRYGRPSFGDDKKQYSEKWLKATEWLEERLSEIDIIIDGHGQIMSTDELRSFISFVRKCAEKPTNSTRFNPEIKIDSLVAAYYRNDNTMT